MMMMNLLHHLCLALNLDSFQDQMTMKEEAVMNMVVAMIMLMLLLMLMLKEKENLLHVGLNGLRLRDCDEFLRKKMRRKVKWKEEGDLKMKVKKRMKEEVLDLHPKRMKEAK